MVPHKLIMIIFIARHTWYTERSELLLGDPELSSLLDVSNVCPENVPQIRTTPIGVVVFIVGLDHLKCSRSKREMEIQIQ
jgi:hypothetical protein